MFRNGSCYNVTLLHSCQKFSKALHLFRKVQHRSKKSEGAFCNTPSLEYRNGITPFKFHDALRVLPHKWR